MGETKEGKTQLRRSFLAGLTAVATLAVGACGGSNTTTTTPPEAVSGTVTVNGSSALKPLIDAATDGFQAKYPDATIQATATNSGTGLSLVDAGTVDVGLSDFPASAATGLTSAGQLVDHQVAVSAFGIVVKSAFPVSGVTAAQAKAIFAGTTTNWKDVGGPDARITLVGRPATSGTRKGFDKIVMQDTPESASVQAQPSGGGVVTTVAQSDGSVGYAGFGDIKADSGVKLLKIDGIDAVNANVENGTYKLWFHEHMYTKGAAKGVAKALIDYLLAGGFQDGSQMTKANFIPLAKVKGTSPADS